MHLADACIQIIQSTVFIDIYLCSINAMLHPATEAPLGSGLTYLFPKVGNPLLFYFIIYFFHN